MISMYAVQLAEKLLSGTRLVYFGNRVTNLGKKQHQLKGRSKRATRFGSGICKVQAFKVHTTRLA